MGEEIRKKGFASLDSLVSRVEEAKAPPAPDKSGELSRRAGVRPEMQGAKAAINTGEQEGERQFRSTKRKQIAWVVAGGSFLLLILYSSIKGDATRNTAASPSFPAPSSEPVGSTFRPTPSLTPPTYSAPATTSSDRSLPEQRTYRVPSYRVAELDTDRAAADAAQREAEQLAVQVKSARENLEANRGEAERVRSEVTRLGAEVESERSYLTSTSDESDIASFNAKVDQYNILVGRARRLTQETDELVDPYNALVDRANRESEFANRLVDAYNEKLQRYGR